MTTDITELAQSEINDALAQLKQVSEYPTPSTQYARVLRKYIASLVEALEKAQAQSSKWLEAYHKAVKIGARYEERIAELESRTVKLPPKIERVDADVSDRNQPGMVVAVHIDAGDFVKFRDQVYEVKETDFDDHDVTLWFVCGEVLKCAAGCQIEVVSAPVEDE